jgi:hypothetical protein
MKYCIEEENAFDIAQLSCHCGGSDRRKQMGGCCRSWISQAQKRMDGQVGSRGSERTTSSCEIVPRPCSTVTRSSGACFLGLRCHMNPPITNSAATQPHPTQSHRDGERPSPSLVMGIDVAHWRKVWNTEMTRHVFRTYTPS